MTSALEAIPHEAHEPHDSWRSRGYSRPTQDLDPLAIKKIRKNRSRPRCCGHRHARSGPPPPKELVRRLPWPPRFAWIALGPGPQLTRNIAYYASSVKTDC